MVLEIHDRIFVMTPEGEREIQLCVGDITHLPMEEKVDIILVSAFPNDYAAMTASVIGALQHNLGISVRKLAMHHKKEDHRKTFNCWISKPLPEDKPYRQLVCFERGIKSEVYYSTLEPAEELVESIFRALMPAFNNVNKSVITPLLNSGFQHADPSVMVKAMVNGAAKWMKLGMTLQLFKIVIFSRDGVIPSRMKDVVETFKSCKKRIEKQNKRGREKEHPITNDVFLISSSNDESIAANVKSLMKKEYKSISSVTLSDMGHEDDQWQYTIHQKMLDSARVVPLLSKQFLEHQPCVDAYNVALCARRRTGRNILAPLVLDQFDVPVYMSMVQWINCKMYDKEKIQSASTSLVTQIQQEKSGVGKAKMKYDIFISYSHRDLTQAKLLLEQLGSVNPDLKIFFDYEELKTGVSWQQTLYSALDNTKCVIALVSPDYVKSAVGTEEFNIALARHLAKNKELELVPIILEDVDPSFKSSILKYLKSKDKKELFQRVAVDINSWLQSGEKSEIFSPVQMPVENLDISETERRDVYNSLYKISDGQVHLASKEPLPMALLTMLDEKAENDSNSSDCKVYLSYTVSDEKYVEFVKQCLLAVNYETTFNSKLNDVNSVVQLENSLCIAIFLSSNYLKSKKEVDEFNVILGKLRSKGNTHRAYLVLLDDLPAFPTYFHLVCLDTVIEDAMWDELASDASYKMNKTLKDIGKNVAKKYGKMKEKHMLALQKACYDVSYILNNGSYPGHRAPEIGVLQNVWKLTESEMEKTTQDSYDDDSMADFEDPEDTENNGKLGMDNSTDNDNTAENQDQSLGENNKQNTDKDNQCRTESLDGADVKTPQRDLGNAPNKDDSNVTSSKSNVGGQKKSTKSSSCSIL